MKNKFTDLEMKQIIEFCAMKGKGCRKCQNLRETEHSCRCGVHPSRLALELIEKKEQEIKALREAFAALLIETNDDVCSLCKRVNEFLIDEDLPDNIEACPFKREKGIAACVEGIVEHATGWRNG